MLHFLTSAILVTTAPSYATVDGTAEFLATYVWIHRMREIQKQLVRPDLKDYLDEEHRDAKP